MSFREKAAWIAVLTTIPIWGFYFWSVWQAYWSLALDGQAILNLFLVCLGVTIAIILGLNLLSAWLGKHQFGANLDELERAVDARANAWGARLLEWAVLGVAAASPWAVSQIATAYPQNTAYIGAVVVANALLFVVLSCQMIHELVHIISRRIMG